MNTFDYNQNINFADYDNENELVEVVFTQDLLNYVKKIGLIEGIDYFIDN